MSERRIKCRVPSARKICIAFLYEHDLRFHKRSIDGSGKCDAYYTGNNQDYVLGVLYEIADSDKKYLDRKEGLGKGYDEKIVQITTPAGEMFAAVMYFATNIDQDLKPFMWYKEHVLNGALENHFPKEYIDKINSVEAAQDPNKEREKRERNIYKHSS